MPGYAYRFGVERVVVGAAVGAAVVLGLADVACAQQYELIDLGALGGTHSGAEDINEAGQIVGFGVPPDALRLRAYLLEPVCDADFGGDGGVDTLDVLAFLNACEGGTL